jgi:hypothetical protein
MNENIYNLKQSTEKFKGNTKQVYNYNPNNSPFKFKKVERKFQLYNSKSLDKDSLKQLMNNKEKNRFIYDLDIKTPLKNSKNPSKISSLKFNSPVKSGPFDKEKLT